MRIYKGICLVLYQNMTDKRKHHVINMKFTGCHVLLEARARHILDDCIFLGFNPIRYAMPASLTMPKTTIIQSGSGISKFANPFI